MSIDTKSPTDVPGWQQRIKLLSAELTTAERELADCRSRVTDLAAKLEACQRECARHANPNVSFL